MAGQSCLGIWQSPDTPHETQASLPIGFPCSSEVLELW